ncbi:MAG: hypothetical protein ACD_28C00278G0003 [uncultured bacterium]|nr:MAG: hypothetical protein ACD_28C00278G0003 [uncultured bacterium]KKT76145.1 MAG: hypothetical protein UW70_C0021G0012 [Candidatus Peregrinibacteria bacterium GW2011_GWA2_44_7]
MKLSIKAFGLAAGLMWGSCLLILTLVAYYTGYGMNQLDFLLVGIYPGYSLSPVGALVGGIEGFVDGMLGGMIFAWLYNKCVYER